MCNLFLKLSNAKDIFSIKKKHRSNVVSINRFLLNEFRDDNQRKGVIEEQSIRTEI